jgi:hypothetical protein
LNLFKLIIMIKLVIFFVLNNVINIIYIYKELGKFNISTCLSKTWLIENNFKSICPMIYNLMAAV